MESIKVLVTGAGGFMGSHLVDFLHEKGYEVYGIYFGSVDLTDEIKNKGNLIKLDIRDYDKLKELISKIKPDQIYHLAAQSYPTVSWKDPKYTFETNVQGTANVFEAVKELGLKTKILVAGSSAQYGFVQEHEVPVKENREMKPLHPYGVSKVAQEGLTYQYAKNFGIHGFTMRIFNTTGPRKVNDVCSDFTKQAAAISLGLQKPIITVGNLNTRRAITDVRDEIRGFYLAMQKAEPGAAYNISGAKAYLIKDILDMALKCASINPEIKVDPALLRPTDEPIIFGDSTTLNNITGWKQEITIEQTIRDMVDYWRKKLEVTQSDVAIRNLEDSSKLLLETKSQTKQINEAAKALVEAFKRGNKLIAAGNGGSAADAQHMTGELVCSFYDHKRKGLPAVCLHGDSSALTAWANDADYHDFFRRGLEAHGHKGDIFFAITTSGNSKNLITAAEYAKKNGIIVVGLLGKGGGKILPLCDYAIVVPHNDTARIQEAHHVIYHTICEIVEKKVFENA